MAAPAGTDSAVVLVSMEQETEVTGIATFGKVGGLKVRLDEMASNFTGVANLILPLVTSGKRMKCSREVLQRFTGKVGSLDEEMPPVRRVIRFDRKEKSEMTCAPENDLRGQRALLRIRERFE